MRDFSHGKARKESTKDYESFRLQVSGKMTRMTGNDLDSFGFTREDIMGVIQFDSQTAAELLLAGTDYVSDRANHGPASTPVPCAPITSLQIHQDGSDFYDAKGGLVWSAPFPCLCDLARAQKARTMFRSWARAHGIKVSFPNPFK